MSTENKLLAGVARSDISPDNAGLLHRVWAMDNQALLGVLHPISVEALALQQGVEVKILISADLIDTQVDVAARVKETVARESGIQNLDILFRAAHNHSAEVEAHPDDTPEFTAALEAFRQKTQNGYIQACLEACRNLQPAELAAGRAELDQPVGECRRMQVANGTCITSWGAGPPSIPGFKFAFPSGLPENRQVDFLCVRRPGEQMPFAIFINYASHIHLAQIPYFDADTAGAVKRELERRIPGVTALYANGTAGDIDMHCVHPQPWSDSLAERMAWYEKSASTLANRMVDGILRSIPKRRYIDTCELRYQNYSGSGLIGFPLTLSALRLGDIGIVSLPGEIFHAFGIRLQEESPFPSLLVLGYNETGADSNYGYTATPLDYEKGAYEIKGRIPRSKEEEEALTKAGVALSLTRPETGTIIVDKLIEMLYALAG